MSKEVMSVKEIIQSISKNRTQTSANSKDEIRVAQAMMNDPTFSVDVYGKEGKIATFSPYAAMHDFAATVIQNATKITEPEAKRLVEDYQFGKDEATDIVNFSKEFINTYLDTGRKLPLGCREKSNCSLIRVVKEAKVNSYPVPNGIDANGEKTYTTATGITPEYHTIKVSGACPAHLKAAANQK